MKKISVLAILGLILLLNDLSAISILPYNIKTIDYPSYDYDLTGYTIYSEFNCPAAQYSNICEIHNMEAVINPNMIFDMSLWLEIENTAYIDVHFLEDDNNKGKTFNLVFRKSTNSYIKLTGLADSFLNLKYGNSDPQLDPINLDSLITDAKLLYFDISRSSTINNLYAPDSILWFDLMTQSIKLVPYIFQSNNSVLINSLALNSVASNNVLYKLYIDAKNFSVVGGRICEFDNNINSCTLDSSIQNNTIRLLNNTNFLLEGAVEPNWDGVSIPQEVQYISTLDQFQLGNDSIFTLKSYLALNKIDLVEANTENASGLDLTFEEIQNNNSTLIIDGGFMNLNYGSKTSNRTTNLVLNNGKLSINDGDLTIYNDFTMQGDSSLSIRSGDLIFDNQKANGNHDINIELTSFNSKQFAIELQNGSLILSKDMRINVYIDSSNFLQVGKLYTFSLIEAQNAQYIKDQVITDSPATWISIDTVSDSNSIFVVANRTQSYTEVLMDTNTNEFSLSLAEAIDTEMSDGVVSDDLAKYIANLDSTGDAEGLQQALGSNIPVDRNYFINFLSKNDVAIADILQDNSQGPSDLWVGYNYGLGTMDEHSNNVSNIMIGYRNLLNNKNIVNFGIGLGSGKLDGDNFTSQLKSAYIGVNYEYIEDIYFNIGLVSSYNIYDTNRVDSIDTLFNSKSAYQDFAVNTEVGTYIVNNYFIALRGSLYFNYDSIKMFAYKENNDVGYSYEDEIYSASQGGLKISGVINKGVMSENFQLKFSGKIGYKADFGEAQNIGFNVGSVVIQGTEIAVDSKGLFVQPQIALAYSNGNVMLQVSYSYEYMQDTYIDNSIKIVFKYSL